MKNEIELIKELWNEWSLNKNSQKLIANKGIFDGLISELDSGKIRICNRDDNGNWLVNEWLKQAILMYFISNDSYISKSYLDGNNEVFWFDKIPNKFCSWAQEKFENSKIRAVPGCFVRKGAYIANNCIIMPSFVNIGAYIDSGTMIDCMSTIGSCAQIGKNCHISAQVCVGGVLEPIQAAPVIIEDECFIGAGCQLAEGVIIKKGSILAAGTILTGSTKIVDRATKKISYGIIPEGSVIVPGSLQAENGISLNCAIIIKNVDLQTKSKTSINDILRQN